MSGWIRRAPAARPARCPRARCRAGPGSARPAFDLARARSAVGRVAGLVALVLEDRRDRIADRRLVVDDQDIARSCRLPALRATPSRPPYAPRCARSAAAPSTLAVARKTRLAEAPPDRPIAEGQHAAVLLHDLLHDGEAEAGAARPRGHIGLGQPLPAAGRPRPLSSTSITDRSSVSRSATITQPACPVSSAPLVALRHRLDRVL